MKKESKNLLTISIVFIVLLGLGMWAFNNNGPQEKADSALLMNADSHSTAVGTYQYKVTIVEFGDYECPACGFAHPFLKKIAADYNTDVNFVFRNFPLPQHKTAMLAARAAEAAGQQEKFWEMHDKIYETQEAWSEKDNALDIFVSYAEVIGLNIEQFKQDLNNNALLQKIQNDKNDGDRLGVSGTPTFFINGKKFNQALNYATLKNAVDTELKQNKSIN